MTEKEKMLAGKLYDISDNELVPQYLQTRRLVKAYNESDYDDLQTRSRILAELLGACGENVVIAGPVQFDYGVNTTVGNGCHINYNFTVLDCGRVTIGNDVYIGPNCSLVTPVHPLLCEERKSRTKADGTHYDLEYAKPIVLCDGVWLATNVTVCGGVTIGKNAFCYKDGHIDVTSLELPSTLTSISDYAFTRLRVETLVIPASVTTMGGSVFIGNTALKKLVVLGSMLRQTPSRCKGKQ